MSSGAKPIQIPFSRQDGSIEFYTDELPDDHYDLIDVLRKEFAPLKIWKTCAVEYFKQGLVEGFDAILQDIVEELKNEEVVNFYKSREDYNEALSEIYLCLAAKELIYLSRSKIVSLGTNEQALTKKCVEYLKLAGNQGSLNEYAWILNGFYAVLQNDVKEIKRTEEPFKNVYDRAVKGQATKKKFLFGALVGLGMTAYSQGNYQLALDHLTKAVMNNPKCSPTVRIAIACCCFKLQQYDRARYAVQRAVAMDASDVNQLVMYALLDLAEAKRDRENRTKLRQCAYEYLYLAQKIDPSYPPTLTLLANHDFHAWRTVSLGPSGRIISSDRIVVPLKGYHEIFELGNQIRLTFPELYKNSTHLITERKELTEAELAAYDIPNINNGNGAIQYYEIAFSPPVKFNISYPYATKEIDIKNLKSVHETATKALLSTTVPALKAECLYILAKVAHVHKNFTSAFELYDRALQLAPAMAPAAFGAAQIYFARQDFEHALETFNDVLEGNLQDKDTQAYVILLKSMLKEEIAPFEKLREVCPGFLYEIDLWLVQAELRHKKPHNSTNPGGTNALTSELGESLKCYMLAKECYDAQQLAIPTKVYGNISTVYFLLGNLEKAMEYVYLAISTSRTVTMDEPLPITKQQQVNIPQSADGTVPSSSSLTTVAVDASILYKLSEFNGVFYGWNKKKPLVQILQDREHPEKFHVPLDSEDTESMQKIAHQLAAGQEILIEDMLWTIISFEPTTLELLCQPRYGFTPYRYVNFDRLRELRTKKEKDATEKKELSPILSLTEESSELYFLNLYKKEYYNTFQDQTLTYIYNLARILEESGNTHAANILYETIIKVYPSHVDCYLRMARICKVLGKTKDAIQHVLTAQMISPNSIDIAVTLADLYGILGQIEDAKKIYEQTYTKNRNDPQALLALGNYWYNTYNTTKRNDENQLRTSYKFYHSVLMNHVKSIYAANGLGMVFAMKNEFTAARETFSKIKQANMRNTEDTDLNLANVYMAEERFLEAQRLYHFVLKNVVTNPNYSHSHYATIFNLIGIAEAKCDNPEGSLRSFLRAWHLSPVGDVTILYNLSHIVNRTANMLLEKGSNKTLEQIELIRSVLVVSVKILSYLKNSKKSVGIIDRGEVSNKLRAATERLEVLKKLYDDVFKKEQSEMEKRQEFQARHQLLKTQREEDERRRAEKEEEEKRNRQLKALEKQSQYEEKLKYWVKSGDSTAAGGKSNQNDDDSDVEGGAGPIFGEDEGDAAKAKNKRKRKNDGEKRSKKSKKNDDDDHKGTGGKKKRSSKLKKKKNDGDSDDEGDGDDASVNAAGESDRDSDKDVQDDDDDSMDWHRKPSAGKADDSGSDVELDDAPARAKPASPAHAEGNDDADDIFGDD